MYNTQNQLNRHLLPKYTNLVCCELSKKWQRKLSKGHYACCDLVKYDLVALYGIESSSILYNTLYVMYDHTIL